MAYGDHLVRDDGLYLHHGMDLGTGAVIEYGGKKTGRPSVRVVPLQTFASGKPVRVKPHPPRATLPPAVAVRRAFARIGESRYDALANNCEHFVNWCKTNNHTSQQAEDVKAMLTLGLLVAGFVIVAKSAK